MSETVKKKILISINTAWNIYNFRASLIESMIVAGYEVIAVSPYDNYVDKLLELGVEWFRININNKGSNPLEDLLLTFNYYKIFKKIKPDLVLLYTIKPNLYGNIAAKLIGVPVISNISGLGTVFLNSGVTSTIAQLLYKFSLSFPQKIFFQNKEDYQLFITKRLIDKFQGEVIPGSGINLEKFKRSNFVNQENDKFTFLLVARMVKDKGVIEYYKASLKLRKALLNVRCLMVGPIYPGNPTSIHESILREWSSQETITYLGASDNVKELMELSDCVVLPSYREGLSHVLLEAAALELPIITTNVPGCRDLVEDNLNGFLCAARNVDDLFDKMKKMILLSRPQRIDMGRKGRAMVEKKFDENFVINRYLETIDDILSVSD